ncbi:MAG: SAM-dependent methyltransferase, partial [Acidimicrobiales bacterium]
LGGVVVPGGRYHLLCFSDQVPGDWGPRRVGEDELRASFAQGWRVDAISEAVLATTFMTDGVPAWLASFTRD